MARKLFSIALYLGDVLDKVMSLHQIFSSAHIYVCGLRVPLMA